MLTALLVASLAAVPADFPEPEGLEPNVSFWEGIYATWSSGEVVFHDRLHMGVVWDVLDLGELRYYPHAPDPAEQRRRVQARRELIEERKDAIVDALRRLEEMQGAGELDIDGLDPLLARVHAAAEAGGLTELSGAEERLRWQHGLADLFFEGLVRYDAYGALVERAIVAAGAPRDLVALAFVESLFHPTAVSHVGAAGMFQFMPATGPEYGLTRGPGFDKRMDPVLAAEAAARHLQRSHQRLGNWPLALTAYNHGPNGVARAVEQVGSRDLMDLIERYEARRWGFASRNFYAQFLAVRRVLARRYEHFGEWVPHFPLHLAAVRIEEPVELVRLFSGRCLDRRTLSVNNPALQASASSGGARLPAGMLLWVSPEEAEAVALCTAEIVSQGVDGSLLAATSYTVRLGDTVTGIAARHRACPVETMELNGIGPDGLIRVGQVLRLPTTRRQAGGASVLPLSE